MKNAPHRQPTDAGQRSAALLSLPLPDGSLQDFRVQEAPVMHPDLAAIFPEIKTYLATSASGSVSYARLDWTLHGFHALIFDENGATFLIEPDPNQPLQYFIFNKNENPARSDFQCAAEAVRHRFSSKINTQHLQRLGGDCTRREYRLALACTGEYANFHGGTTAAALSAMVTTLNRVNGVLETDLAIHLTLVPNNHLLIFTNPATDPFTNNDGVAMLDENQATVDALIGNANYDIGHVFSTGGGGVAYTGAICFEGYKAGGSRGRRVRLAMRSMWTTLLTKSGINSEPTTP